ncbi:MAG: hypothetical protein GY854_29855 [Deltaproteobacteria bacterium]|nr:hypothetical protein [Deltaproteobacteria bacterium]
MNYNQHRQKGLIGAGLAFLVCLTLSGTADAAYKIGDDESYVKIGGLLQGWAAINEGKAPDGEAWENEFYLRRMRLMFYGQINKWVNFFVETDNPNFGKGGDLSMNMFIQDAYLEFNIHEMFQLDIGMLLLPFSHHGMQGATSLLGLDYHGALVRYPGGSTKVWRDYGVMVRGIFFTKWLEYRLGVFNGVHGNLKDTMEGGEGDVTWDEPADPRNSRDWPRFTARLTFNIFEPEGGAGVGGMFYDGIYLKKTDEGVVSTKKVLSIGGSVDWQKDLNVTWDDPPGQSGVIPEDSLRTVKSRDSYVGAAGDVFLDIPLDAKKLWSLNGQVNFYYYNYGDRSEGNTWYDSIGDTKSYTGLGISSELGIRYNAIQPLFIFDWYNSTKAASDSTGDYMGVYGGFNYWLFGHSTSLKIQFGANQANGGDWGLAGTFQAQLLF